MEERTYEMIIDDVEFGFEEYMGKFDFTVIEAVAKTIEDNHAIFRKGAFIKYAHLVQLGLGSISRGEVPDYVYEKLAEADSAIAELEDQEIEQLKKDFELYQRKIKSENYTIIDTPFPTKASADYHLGDGLYKDVK